MISFFSFLSKRDLLLSFISSQPRERETSLSSSSPPLGELPIALFPSPGWLREWGYPHSHAPVPFPSSSWSSWTHRRSPSTSRRPPSVLPKIIGECSLFLRMGFLPIQWTLDWTLIGLLPILIFDDRTLSPVIHILFTLGWTLDNVFPRRSAEVNAAKILSKLR